MQGHHARLQAKAEEGQEEDAVHRAKPMLAALSSAKEPVARRQSANMPKSVSVPTCVAIR